MAQSDTQFGTAKPVGGRLNVLLTDDAQLWAEQLPRLLAPQGVRTVRACTVDDAVAAIETEPVHAAVIDLGLPMSPMGRTAPGSVETGGLKLLRLVRRMCPPCPTVVVRGRLFDGRTDDRMLREALKLNAFSVLDQPVQIEQLLETLRRLLQRHYGGSWPSQN